MSGLLDVLTAVMHLQTLLPMAEGAEAVKDGPGPILPELKELAWAFGVRADWFSERAVIPFIGVNWKFAPGWDARFTAGHYRESYDNENFGAFGPSIYATDLDRSKGWEIGAGPTVVVVNEGVAKSLSSTTLTGDAYAFAFDQQGLMASLSIEGSKISRIQR